MFGFPENLYQVFATTRQGTKAAMIVPRMNYSWVCRKQSTMWSSTMPVACMNA